MAVDDEKTLNLIVKSPAGLLFEQIGLKSVQLELSDGKIGIRSGHAPMISEIGDGEAVLDDGEKIEKVPLHAGIAVVEGDVITIYTDTIDAEFSNPDVSFVDRENDTEELYEAIIATLLPGAMQAENIDGD